MNYLIIMWKTLLIILFRYVIPRIFVQVKSNSPVLVQIRSLRTNPNPQSLKGPFIPTLKTSYPVSLLIGKTDPQQTNG